MKAVRFGSYSSRSTVAGMSTFVRLKSTTRYDCLWPPPRKRTTMRPVLLRPPEECLPSVKLLTGLPLYSAERSTITSWRWPGVVGLYVFNAIVVAPYSPVVTSMRWPSSRVTIARFLDLRLGRLGGDPEHNLVVLGRNSRLFGHHRSDDHVVMARIDILHLK